MDLTKVIAIYGAVLSTAVFAWQVLSYVQRKRLRVKVTVTVEQRHLQDPMCITRIVNLSEFPVRVRAFGLLVYGRSWFSRFRAKANLLLLELDDTREGFTSETFEPLPYRQGHDFRLDRSVAVNHLRRARFSPKGVRLKCFIELTDGSRHSSSFLPDYYLVGKPPE